MQAVRAEKRGSTQPTHSTCARKSEVESLLYHFHIMYTNKKWFWKAFNYKKLRKIFIKIILRLKNFAKNDNIMYVSTKKNPKNFNFIATLFDQNIQQLLW